MQKQSPPMPVLCGSMTPSTAVAATAASTALPPARSTSMAVSVASGWEVAAMPSLAITGERPGRWKSRGMMDGAGLGDMRQGAFDGEIALRRTQRHRKAPHDVDETDDQQQEEGRTGGLLHQQEFDQHAEEQDQRQRMIDHGADTDTGRLHDLAEQQQDRQGDQHVARRHGPVAARNHVDVSPLAGPGQTGHQEGDDVVDREGDQQQREAEDEHSQLPNGWITPRSSPSAPGGLYTCRSSGRCGADGAIRRNPCPRYSSAA